MDLEAVEAEARGPDQLVDQLAVPVVQAGHDEADVAPLKQAGVAAVYTPKDFDLSRIMRDIVGLLDGAPANGATATGAAAPAPAGQA